MLFAHYKQLCSHLLDVPVSTIHITEKGEIRLSYYKHKIPVVKEKDVRSLGLLQACLNAEFDALSELEKSKAINQELQNSLANRTEFFDGIGHELRTPLNAVLNLSEVLSEMKLPDEASKVSSTIHRSALQVSRLVEDALSLNALDRGQMKVNPAELQPHQFLSGLVDQLAPVALRYGATLVCHADQNLPSELISDPEKLEQIVSSLVYHGFLRNDETLKINVSVSWLGSGLSIYVSAPDLGLGLAEKEALLRPWSETDESERMGLSMTVTNALIKLMGGNLKISNHPDSGCIMRAWVPAQLSEKQKVKEKKARSEAAQKANILAADDDPTSLFVLEHVIGRLGYNMSTVESGTTVLKHVASEEFNLLLLDLHMPGMDGFEVAEAIKKELKLDIPIVAMSADTTDLARARAIEVGMVEFLPKPLKRDRLSQVLEKVLSQG